MAGEVFRFIGQVTELDYGSCCLPDASDEVTADFINKMYDIVFQRAQWLSEGLDTALKVQIHNPDWCNDEDTWRD